MLGFVFYLERVFHVDLLLQKVSFSAYGGRSIANWGDTDVLTDNDVERGLELLTALPTNQVYYLTPLPSLYLSILSYSLPHHFCSHLNSTVRLPRLYFSSLRYSMKMRVVSKMHWNVIKRVGMKPPTTFFLLLLLLFFFFYVLTQ